MPNISRDHNEGTHGSGERREESAWYVARDVSSWGSRELDKVVHRNFTSWGWASPGLLSWDTRGVSRAPHAYAPAVVYHL